LSVLARSRPTEETRREEGHAERDPERDAIVELVAHDERHARAQRRHLGEREVHEDHLTAHDVEAHVDQKRSEEQTGGQRPLHDLPRELKFAAHFFSWSAVEIVFTSVSIKSKYVAVFGSAPGCCETSTTVASV